MKKINYGNQITVPTKEMIVRKNEERYYKALEKSFKAAKQPDQQVPMAKSQEKVQVNSSIENSVQEVYKSPKKPNKRLKSDAKTIVSSNESFWEEIDSRNMYNTLQQSAEQAKNDKGRSWKKETRSLMKSIQSSFYEQNDSSRFNFPHLVNQIQDPNVSAGSSFFPNLSPNQRYTTHKLRNFNSQQKSKKFSTIQRPFQGISLSRMLPNQKRN